MAKIFETSGDIVEMAENTFNETGLPQIGIRLKVMSLTKANTIVKACKASATTEFLTHGDGTVHLFIYETAFDRLSDDMKKKLLEGALSNVSYDDEKDKLNVDNSQYGELIRMRRKYPDYPDIIENSVLLIEQIAEEDKERKAAEKEIKKNKK